MTNDLPPKETTLARALQCAADLCIVTDADIQSLKTSQFQFVLHHRAQIVQLAEILSKRRSESRIPPSAKEIVGELCNDLTQTKFDVEDLRQRIFDIDPANAGKEAYDVFG